MRKYLYLLLVGIVSCGGSKSNSSNEESILGVWTVIHEATQCIDTYRFNADDSFEYSSLDNITEGSFRISEEKNADGMYSLLLFHEFNNRQTGCDGNNTGLAQTGFTDIYTLHYIEFTNEFQIKWYISIDEATILNKSEE